MIIIAGSSNSLLAKTIAKKINALCVDANVKHFEDQELRIQIEAQLYEQDVIIVQSTSKPANDHLMELLLLADTARRAGARRIIAVIPYFGYSRQDRPSYAHGPISASLVATLLESSGINRIITLDLHSKQIEGFFKIGIHNLEAFSLFSKLFINKKDNVIVSPDIGGLMRAQKFSNDLGCNLAVINKIRAMDGECSMSEVIGDVKAKHCIIIDDIIDTAGTICKAAELLITKGALSVKACVTHPVLSKNAIELIEKSFIDKLYVTNSILHKNLSDKIEVISIDELLASSLI